MERVLEPEVMDTPEEADGYDSMDHSVANESFVSRLSELGAKGRMLDVGTGPAHIPCMILGRFPDARITAVDAASHMLRHAERHRASSPHRDRLELKLVDAKSLPFEDASFDVVYSNTVMHHIPDPGEYIAEAWRVLRPGGVFLIRDLFRPDTPARALELVAMHAAGANDYQKELFRASLHAALLPEELRALVRSLGIDGCEVVIDSDRHMSLQTRCKPPRR